MIKRADLLKRIQSNINKNGYHITLVNGMELPRFAYTIGGEEAFGSELIFAGGEFYSKSHVNSIISQMINELKKVADWQEVFLKTHLLGSFTLSKVDKTWSELLALGALDFNNQNEIKALQILPDKDHRTLDIPDLSKVFDVITQPVWQWLVREWDYPVPRNSTVITNLDVLFGEKTTELMRWGTDEWEMFSGAGSDVPKVDMRVVPLGVLIGIDKSLEPAVYLEVGKGLWRDPTELVWNNWG